MATQSAKTRKPLRTLLTKQVNELQPLLAADPVDRIAVTVGINILTERYDELIAADTAVLDHLIEGDAPEEDIVKEMESCNEYKKKYLRIKLACDEILQPERDDEQVSGISGRSGNSANSKVSAVVQGRRTFKLPRIEFKKFDGNLMDWLSFWAQFKKVHEDADIDEHDKIEYLIQATVPGSRARRIVESFPAMAGNYQKIVDSLESRFGRNDLQVEVYVRELLKLVLVNVSSQNKFDLPILYDRIETQLRALDTLGITAEKSAAILFPLIESSLPHDLSRVWQRSHSATLANSTNDISVEARLKNLMIFLRGEVENEQRVSLAAEGFGICTPSQSGVRKQEKCKLSTSKEGQNNATAAGLVNHNSNLATCIFCKGDHNSDSCFKAQKMTLEQKTAILTEKGACFRCLKGGHSSRKCFNRLRCIICSKPHVVLMCPNLVDQQKSVQHSDKKEHKPVGKKEFGTAPMQNLSNHTANHVFLQTLKLNLKTGRGLHTVRVLIDSGSQKSYILKDTAKRLNYGPKRTQTITHGLFGGSTIDLHHSCYDITLVGESNSRTFEVLDQPTICQNIPTVFYGPWNVELESLNIKISDIADATPIEILIGADVAGYLYTGNRRELDCGLVAIETIFGWTLMGRPYTCTSNFNAVLSCLVTDISTPDLWKLDVLGITDPAEKKTRDEMALAAQQHFNETVKVDVEGRYEIRLPWVADHLPLPTNYELSKKRLDSTLKNMKGTELHRAYDEVFQDWLKIGIIEEVPEDQPTEGHYLPHRPVIKGNSTTKIRPVFDASAHTRTSPSLNNCLEKGVNLIEHIPSIILRFREFRIGVVSDIEKAFLQISVNKEDRKFLKFLWTDPENISKVYRHKRVVFGVSSSPFLLGSTINYHLKDRITRCDVAEVTYTKDTLVKLSESFYVDNCVTSVENVNLLTKFIHEAQYVMEEARMNLRGWEFTGDNSDTTTISVLGLTWDKENDVLTINVGNITEILNKEETLITKRVILSIVQRLFDPIGFTCPVTLIPKLLLQRMWETQIPWDKEVDEEIQRIFRNWANEMSCLTELKIPRWIGFQAENSLSWSVHTFCDASKDAFSAVVFLRLEHAGKILVHLLAAKTRVAPLKKLTIPRLELLAATIGARLCKGTTSILTGLGECYFWSDSSTVISWIKRKEEWSTFVYNRISEIRELSTPESWRHVPGALNPADLPSRGCSPKQLLVSKWWEGPEWLYLSPECWPNMTMEINEEEVAKERKRKLVQNMLNLSDSNEWHLTYFSKYSKLVRMMAWIIRLTHNAKNRHSKKLGELNATEYDTAEKFVLKIVQNESFCVKDEPKLKTLNTFRDEYGLIRLKSRVANRVDEDNFRYPIVLCADHEIVQRLVYQRHVNSSHVGVQGLLSILRERYWILGGRRSVKKIISSCSVCKRHHSKHFVVEPPVLPLNRVRDAVAFEVTGVDFAGPLFLKGGTKAWICLFTCAVYRAIHLELVDTMSTVGFIRALRRFVARRGRPKTVYSDNGTNFIGTENSFERVNWDEISQYAVVERIDWKFNPPSASWWGGFWERLIGVVKPMLKKVLGHACLTFEELTTVLCDCEAVVNARPLTYTSNDPDDFAVLTPVMFLREQIEYGVPDCDEVDRTSLIRRVRYMQKLRVDLRRRFRNEYLGQLRLVSYKKASRAVQLGELVLIGDDVNKRLNWPLGRVIELIPGKDGVIRLVRIKTEKGFLLRPVQRLFPMELTWKEEEAVMQPEDVVETVSARVTEVQSRVPDVSARVTEVQSRVPDDSARVTGVEEEPVRTIRITRSGRVSRPSVRYEALLFKD